MGHFQEAGPLQPLCSVEAGGGVGKSLPSKLQALHSDLPSALESCVALQRLLNLPGPRVFTCKLG